MPKFIVTVKEVWDQNVAVTAKNSKEAIDKVFDGEGVYLEGGDDFVYNRTLDSAEWWDVFEAKPTNKRGKQ